MSEDIDLEVPDTGDEEEAPQQEQPPVNLENEVAKWKALARQHETRAKANAEAAQRLKALEDSGKSESEKMQAALEESKKQAREATVRALKYQIAQEKGLPPALAKFLPDVDNEVDMLQAAADLLEAAGGSQASPTRPKSNLTNPLGDEDPSATQERLISAMLGRT